MKKIIKADGIITNMARAYKNSPKNARNPVFAYISYRVGGQWKTSGNTITVRFDAKNGEHMTVYYVEGKPYKVFKYAILARLFG